MQRAAHKTVLVPRVRTFGVRLSGEEFVAFEKFCIENGAHSMSEVARNAIKDFIRGANRKSALASSADRNSARVKSLEERLERVQAEIAALRVPAPGTAAPPRKSRYD